MPSNGSNESKDDESIDNESNNNNGSNNSDNESKDNETIVTQSFDLDISYNNYVNEFELDASCNETVVPQDVQFVVPKIVQYTLNEVIDASGYELTNQRGKDISGSDITYTHFETTEPELYDPQIEEKFVQVIETYNDETDLNSETSILVNQIKSYASQINCSDFHGKGTIDDYTQIFEAAAKIANESKQLQLDIDIEGFNEFGAAADELSELFSTFIVKLQNVNIIDDLGFLTSISIALSKIVKLSNVFGQFKEVILTTTTIQFPKSAHDTRIVLEGVMDEIQCAMRYIGYFVDASQNAPEGAALSDTEQAIIDKAVATIDNWNVVCEQGATIAMANNVDVSFIAQASNELKLKTSSLQNVTRNLRTKFAKYNIYPPC